MDEVTKLMLGNKLRVAQPVEPLRKAQSMGADKRSSSEETESANRARRAAEEQQQAESKEAVEKSAALSNKVMQQLNTSLRFSVHEELQRFIVSLVDDQTGEIIKEIPPKELLDMAARLKEVSDAMLSSGKQPGTVASGLFIDAQH